MSQENNLSEIINEEIRAVAPYFGVKPELATDMATAVVEKLRLRAGGAALYLRKNESKNDIKQRNQAIFQAFNGTNYAELARAFKKSKRQIERIINHQRRRMHSGTGTPAARAGAKD